MSKAIALARTAAADPADLLRHMVVIGSALALILAGRVLPLL